VPAAWVVF
jgi:hypothetical protein